MKQHHVVVRYPRKERYGEFSDFYRYTKRFSNLENAQMWAAKATLEIERARGNLWPTEILVDGQSVGFDWHNIMF